MGATGSRSSASADASHRDEGAATEDPIVSLSSWPQRASSPASLCKLLLQAAAQDNTQLFFALLPAELRTRVDELVRPPCHVANGLIAVPVPEMEGSSFNKQRRPLYAVRRNGERLLIFVVGKGFTHVVRLDLPLGDLYRDKRISGEPLALVDLRPKEEAAILLTNLARSHMQLIDLDMNELAKWSAPPSALQYDEDTGWITCDNKLCHVTRRHRILLYPRSAPRAAPNVKVCIWGAEGAERMSAANDTTKSVHVYDLTNGTLVYKLKLSRADKFFKWRTIPTLGLLVKEEAENTDQSYHMYRLSSGTPLAAQFGGELIRHNKAVVLPFRILPLVLQYWTPRDPNRVNQIEFGSWKSTHGLDGKIDIFVSQTDLPSREFLILLWEYALAVRTDLDVTGARWYFWQDVAFVTLKKNLRHLYMLHLPLREGSDNRPLPRILPDPAAAPLLAAKELYAGYTKQFVVVPVGSEDALPLIVDSTPDTVYALRV